MAEMIPKPLNSSNLKAVLLKALTEAIVHTRQIILRETSGWRTQPQRLGYFITSLRNRFCAIYDDDIPPYVLDTLKSSLLRDCIWEDVGILRYTEDINIMGVDIKPLTSQAFIAADSDHGRIMASMDTLQQCINEMNTITKQVSLINDGASRVVDSLYLVATRIEE